MCRHKPGIYLVYTKKDSERIYQVYTRYIQIYLKIIELVYTRYIPGIYFHVSYDRYIPGIYQVYTQSWNIPGIYQVYTMKIQFLGIPITR